MPHRRDRSARLPGAPGTRVARQREQLHPKDAGVGDDVAMDGFPKPTTRIPSGEMDVGHCGFALVVSRSAVPVPSAAWLYRFEHARCGPT